MLIIILFILRLLYSDNLLPWIDDVDTSDDFVIDTEITIPQGKIKGSLNLSGTRRFLGIPYATVHGRFQEPGPAIPWSGTLDATQHGPGCKQSFSLFNTFNTTTGVENCLVLNIHTPTSGESDLPVMVFIHGGGFVSGAKTNSILDPGYLVEKNNIVVSINYRLGVLGFLCLRNKGAPGNVGLKDQVAGLRWVKENIKYFGGNPDLITLFGQDVGAASINYLLVTPSTNGLFHRAILQSGSMLMPQAFDDKPIESASAIAAQSGFHSTDPDELLRFYNRIPINNLIKRTTKNIVDDPFASYVFRPCIEAPHEGALITDNPRNLLKSATFKSDVQVIIGYNNEDGLKWATKFNYNNILKVTEKLKELIPDYLEFPHEENKTAFVEDIKRMYFEVDYDISKIEITKGLINYFTDAYVIYPSLATTEYLLDNHNATVFNYQFSFFSTRNYGKVIAFLEALPNPSLPIMDYEGASNGDELFYLFKAISPLNGKLIEPIATDILMIYRMTMMWSYFALKGNPSIPTELAYPIQWSESKKNDLKMLDIFFEFDMKPVQNRTRIDFWKNAYEKYGKY